MPRVTMTPSAFLKAFLTGCIALIDGEKIRLEFDNAKDAKRAQRWLYRERKRLISEAMEAEPLSDPYSLDPLAGVVTEIDGTALVAYKPNVPKIILERSDGGREEISS